MADKEHLLILREGVDEWNLWRQKSPAIPDLSHVYLVGADLSRANLSDALLFGANLSAANLNDADLSGANLNDAKLNCAKLNCAKLSGADLSKASLTQADLNGANLNDANLCDANLSRAHARGANLCGANLCGVNLSEAVLTQAELTRADLKGATLRKAALGRTMFTRAQVGWTVFASVDLSAAIGLDSVRFRGPCTLGLDALQASAGSIPEGFLQQCGLQPWEIANAQLYAPGFSDDQICELTTEVFRLRSSGPLHLAGVFISYSHADAPYVDRVESSLRAAGFPVWRDIHDAVAGPIVRQIVDSIRLQDAVVVVLSDASVNSDWVEFEIEKARAREKREKRDLLCPIALDDSWEGKDSPLWKQLAREKLIVDFSKWETEFDEAYSKLERGLKRFYPPASK